MMQNERFFSKQLLILATACAMIHSSLLADEVCDECIPFTIDARLSYFWPESSSFREFYGNGTVDYQLTGTIPVYQGCSFLLRGLNLWWAADYIENSGHSQGLGNKTKIKMEPVTAGLKWVYPHSWLRPYIGIGLKYYFLQVHNTSDFVKEHISRNGPGCIAETGIQIFSCNHIMGDLFLSYSFKQFGAPSNHLPNVTTTGLDVSGINIGGGIGFQF
ncbi:MAG: hypothetical protein WCF65_02550 [Parachlamydiaceae bacterium]